MPSQNLNVTIVRENLDITVKNWGGQNTIYSGEIDFTAKAEPADPDPNDAVLWQSNGTGYGNENDICIKLTTTGGTTIPFTLLDASKFIP